MKIKSILIVSVLAVTILGFGFVASAQTTDVSALIAQLQAQIQSLMQQIQQLQAQQNGTQQWCYTFNTNLGFSQSGIADVGALHTILDKQGFSYAPDTGNTYDEGTAHAVIQFQTKYKILQTGYVGVLTRAKLNSLYGCGTKPLPTNCTSGQTLGCNVGSGAGLMTCNNGQWSSCVVISPTPNPTAVSVNVTVGGSQGPIVTTSIIPVSLTWTSVNANNGCSIGSTPNDSSITVTNKLPANNTINISPITNTTYTVTGYNVDSNYQTTQASYSITVNVASSTNATTLYKTGFDGGTLYGSLYRSDDGGNTWKVIFRQYKGSVVYAIDPKNINIIYAGGTSCNTMADTSKDCVDLFKSTDGGQNWTNISKSITGQIGVIYGISSTSVDPNNSNIIKVTLSSATASNLNFISTDYGNTWAQQSTQSSITVLSPVGGEVLTENSKLVGSLSSVDSQKQIFEIKWTGTPNPSTDAYSIVRAYLEQNVNGQFTTIGSIVPESYGSIMWIVGEVGDTNCDVFSSTGFAVNPSACIENKMVAPGTYDIKIVNTQANTFGRSNNFTIVASPNPSTCVPNWQCQWGQCLNNSEPWMAVDSNNCGSMAGVPFCAYKTQQCTTPPVVINPITPSSASVGSNLTITGTNFDSKYNEIMFGCSTDGSIVGANVYNIPSIDGKTITTTVPHIMAGAGVSGSLGVEVSYPINCTVSLSNNTGITSNNVPFTVTAGSTQQSIMVTSPSSGEVVHAGSPYVIKWSAPQNLISAFPNVDIVMSVVLPPSNCGSSGCGLAPSNNIFAKVLQNIFGIEHVNAAGPLYFIIANNVPLSQGSYQWNVPSDITSQILNYDIGYQILFYKAGSKMSVYGPPDSTTVPIAPFKSNIFTLAPGTTSMNVPQNSLASISDAVRLIVQELQSIVGH